ncbi:MAG: RNA methyltransferase [Candidatus Bipolaricaulaceae bacterium]
MRNLYIALLHFPMQDRRGRVVATALTSIDVPDIARTACTYGVRRYFVVTPLPSQQEIAGRLRDFWTTEDFPTRREALELVAVRDELEACYEEVTAEEGEPPQLWGTSARPNLPYPLLSWADAGARLAERPTLLLFGTGHGMAEELLAACDAILPPVRAGSGYNHLSVRAAVAIILDRLKGEDHGRHR